MIIKVLPCDLQVTDFNGRKDYISLCIGKLACIYRSQTYRRETHALNFFVFGKNYNLYQLKWKEVIILICYCWQITIIFKHVIRSLILCFVCMIRQRDQPHKFQFLKKSVSDSGRGNTEFKKKKKWDETIAIIVEKAIVQNSKC